MTELDSEKNQSASELAQELRASMAVHLRQKAQEIVSKYGPVDYHVLQTEILQDRKIIRYPVSIVFDSSRIEPGLFAMTEARLDDHGKLSDDDEYIKPVERSYEMVVHEHFKGQPDKLLPLVLYQLPIVNYGDVVTYEDSEVFGSEVMGLSPDDYYQLICNLVDSIPD